MSFTIAEIMGLVKAVAAQSEMAYLSFTKKLGMPVMRPDSGLTNGIEVSTMGGSLGS